MNPFRHHEWHRWHTQHQHRMNHMRCPPVRRRLQHRLFKWFGAAIVATAGTLMAVSWIMADPARSGWERAHNFVSEVLAAQWDRPEARANTAEALATNFDFGVSLADTQGRVLSAHGDTSCASPMVIAVKRDVISLGEVRMCSTHRLFTRELLRFAPAVLAALMVLWAISMRVARRIARPLVELETVAREIGEGKLERRASLPYGGVIDEVGALTLAINDMAARIEKQLRDQRELLAAVSHELRTPLARIRLLVGMAEDTTDPRTLAEFESEIAEMDSLVGDLLANARMDFSALSCREVNAAEIAARALERASLDPTSLCVADPAPRVNADPTLLTRAIGAMIDNARKHGRAPFDLSVNEANDRVCFVLRDHGDGFSDAQIPTALEPFQKGSGSNGVGLGLALVRRIAEAHKGRAWVDNHPEGGARVHVEIPRHGPA